MNIRESEYLEVALFELKHKIKAKKWIEAETLLQELREGIQKERDNELNKCKSQRN